ncbi:DUF2165 family protein [Colwellia sp. MEBiC06753]
MLRVLKILLVLFIGLHALIYAVQNIANLDAAHAALGYVLSSQGHEVYSNTMFFYVTNPVLHWCALWLVIFGELAIGFFGIKGAFNMLMARKGSAEQFHAAKSYGLIAAALALLVWFGLFMTFGAAFFQMWQTEVGTGSMEGAFMFSIASAITMMFVYSTSE